jgi:hypothetical protein
MRSSPTNDSSMPTHYGFGCVISVTSLSITLVYHHCMRARMRASTVLCAKRVLYALIQTLAPALAVVNFLAVTSPPMHQTCGIAQHLIVASVMAAFMELLLLLCYRTSLARDGGREKDVPPISNILQQLEASFASFTASGFASSHYIDGAVRVLAQQPEIAFWASPPIGCCFALCPTTLPCGRRHRATARLVSLLRRAVLLYALGAVVGPTAELWLEGVPGMEAALLATARRAVGALELVVTLLALYAVFITYRLSKAPLQQYHTTLKFAAVKLLVFISPLQRHALVHALGDDEGTWWAHVLTVAQTPVLALLLWRAFPLSELPGRGAERASESDDEVTRLVPDADTPTDRP